MVASRLPGLRHQSSGAKGDTRLSEARERASGAENANTSGRRLRILWISHFVPYPPHGGAFQRSYHLIKRVGAEHELHLLAMRHKRATHPGEDVGSSREALLAHCHAVHIVDASSATRGIGVLLRAAQSLVTGFPLSVGMFRSREMSRLVRELVTRTSFDVIHLDTISVAEHLDDIGDLPALMAHMGAESYMLHRRVSTEPSALKRWFFAREAVMLERYERRMCQRAGINIVVSELDRELMARSAPQATFAVVENGVDVDYFTPVAPSAGRALIFAGRLDQYASRDAILFFLRSVWPLVRSRYADAEIHILGNNPPRELEVLASGQAGVHVHGFVPDVRPYFRNAAVSICPIRDGGGTRMKILDALALGMPIVSTTIGCEGIDVVPERDLLIADSPEQFVHQITRVFDDPALKASLARNARSLAERQYSWERIGRRLLAHYTMLADRANAEPRVLRREAPGDRLANTRPT